MSLTRSAYRKVYLERLKKSVDDRHANRINSAIYDNERTLAAALFYLELEALPDHLGVEEALARAVSLPDADEAIHWWNIATALERRSTYTYRLF